MPRFGLVIDISRCSGCGSCLLAVKDEYIGNDYPGYSAPQPNSGHNWLDLKEIEHGEGDKIKMDYIPLMYRHNRNPKPIAGVPDGAMYVREDGITIIDPVKAKGCKQIVDACVDGTIFWNDELLLPQIYTLDAHRLDKGERLPRCVESCPTQAMHWGDLDDPSSDVSRFTAEHSEEIEDYLQEPGADYLVRYYKLPKPFIAGEALRSDMSDECCEGAKVVLERDGRVEAETATDFMGNFQLTYLDKDTAYSLRISFPGYADYYTEVVTSRSKNLGTIILNRKQP
jgi:Fe-S-cluster-containing dehydrogenase component